MKRIKVCQTALSILFTLFHKLLTDMKFLNELTGIAGAVLLLGSSFTANATVVTYPAPAEAQLNNTFNVEVRQAGSEKWLPVDVYAVKVDETIGGKHNVRTVSMAYFDFDGEVDVRVVSNKLPVKDVRVRPLSYSIPVEVSGNTFTFSLDTPRNLSVEVNGEIFNNLQLFANPLDVNAPANPKKWAKDKNHIYFGPGYHKLDTVMVVGSGKTVYVAGGARIDGSIHVKGDNVKILGRGMVYPEGRGAGLEVQRSNDVEIDGLFSTQCPVGKSNRVKISNVKVMSSYGWGDGFNVFASNDVTYNHIFARTSDDCTTIYATRKGYEGGCRNILTEDAVLWADVAHPFMIGLHGSAAELGTDAPSDVITDVMYRNIDVIDMHENQIDYQGVFAILAGDNNIVKNITFEDIRIENFRKGKLIDIRIPWNKKYCAAPGKCIENILFKDIYYNGDRSELSLIIGYDETRKIKGVTFDNLVINGEHIYDKMPGKPGWYKTSDMARIFIGEHVEDVVFK